MKTVRWLVVVVAVVVGGCYRPAPAEGTPCSAIGTCPDPLQCIGGTCRAEPPDAAHDTATPDDGAVDAPDGPPACASAPIGVWSAGVVIPNVSAGFIDGTPAVSSDGLELYFKTLRGPGMGGSGTNDIYRSTRASTSAAWGAPSPVTELNTNSIEGSPELSPDDLTIYLASNRAGSSGVMDIYKSTRATKLQAWSMPVRVPELSTSSDEEGLTILPSDLVAYFHSNRSGPYHIWRTTRAMKTAPWRTPVEIVAPLNDGDYENPWVSADDCRMYVQAQRQDTLGGDDIYLVSRTTPTGAWSAAVKLLPPSTNNFDTDPWLTPDERTMYFATGGGSGALDLYISTR